MVFNNNASCNVCFGIGSLNFSPHKGQKDRWASIIWSQLGQILFDTLTPHPPQYFCWPIIFAQQLSQKTDFGVCS